MKTYKLGFIGCGNMGRAMLEGAVNTKWCAAEKICLSTKSAETRETIAAKNGVIALENNREVAKNSDIIVLAVKPNIYKSVLEDIREVLKDGQILLAIAPAYSTDAVSAVVGKSGVRVARAMPNTPAQIGQGMSGLCFSDNMDGSERALVTSFFESFGKVAVVREDVMHAVGSVSGSSPAFVYMFIEAMAQGAIKLGIPAKDAILFAAQSTLGAASLVLETGEHPAVLRDNVCSAGGTTIEGVATLEAQGFKGAIIEAMDKTSKKFLQMEENAKKAL